MKKVRDFLVPHKDNNHIPHIFSEKICVGLIVFVVLIYGSSLISTLTLRMSDQVGAVYSSVLVDMTNKARAEENLSTLEISPTLTEVANRKAADMVNNSYFAHTSPTGVTPWYWFSDVGYSFVYAGENLAVGFSESEQVNAGWLNSPTHRANILSAKFTEVGIAVADGFYKGKPTVFVVQMFGNPKFKNTAVASKIEVSEPATDNNVIAVEAPENIQDERKADVLSATAQGAVLNITTVYEDKLLAIARNDTPEAIIEDAVDNNIAPQVGDYIPAPLSTTGDRILVSQPLLVQYIFTIVMILALFSLIVFLALELRSGHMRHAMYGIILLAVTAGLSFANQAMIVVPRLFY